MARNAIGIDIGGTKTRAGRIAEDGQVLAVLTEPTDRDPQSTLALCLRLIEALRDEETLAVGIGVPGQVDFGAQRVLSGGYVDLSSFPFAGQITERTGLKVTIDNDANMALIAETRVGAARGQANVVLLTIGTGIGGAILEGSRILRGKGAAGQLGHLTVVPGGRQCVCGRRGCVETESSGTAFGTHLAEAGLSPDLRAGDLLVRAETDPVAHEVLLRWAAPLRSAIDTLITTVAPDVVLIGGGAGAAALAALSLVPPLPSWFAAPVRAAALGNDAGVVGAALSALPRGRRAVLVNGVPASGKSRVALALSEATGWPVLSLDTVKTPFLIEFGPFDRPTNRRYGRAAYQAIFDMIAQHDLGATVIVDAWFGFQPLAVLQDGLARAGVSTVAEVWCHARPRTIGQRYAARVESRPAGHPGLEYVPELERLAAEASPTGLGALVSVDTEAALDRDRLLREVLSGLA